MFVQWNPWRELNRLEREVNIMFGNRAPSSAAPTHADAPRAPDWQPAVDVHEDAHRILLVADLPGVEEADIHVSVDKNVLTLKGERRAERRTPPTDERATAGDEGYRRIERLHGAFARSFTLPTTVDTDNVGAALKNGVLTLTLPKRAEAQPKQIKVSVAS